MRQIWSPDSPPSMRKRLYQCCVKLRDLPALMNERFYYQLAYIIQTVYFDMTGIY